MAFAFSPPAIPGVGTAGGVTFMLEDRSGADVEFLAEQTNRFLAAARQRPEFASVFTTFIPRDAAGLRRGRPRQGAQAGRRPEPRCTRPCRRSWVAPSSTTSTASDVPGRCTCRPKGDYRTQAREHRAVLRAQPARASRCRCRRWSTMEPTYGPEFTMRYNGYRARRRSPDACKPGYSSGQGMAALEEVFRETHAGRDGLRLHRACRSRRQVAQQGVPACVIFGFSLLVVFLILAAQYESWSLPFSVLLGMPIAVFGAFAALWLRGSRQRRLRADRSGHADRPRREERHPDRRVRQGRVREGQVDRRRGAERGARCACGPF